MDSSMISAQALIIPVDFGQIYIRAALSELDEWDEDEQPPELAALDDAWESGRFVGVRQGLVDVLTPGQWNWHTPLQLELWSAEPPDDRADWDHEVDADLDVTDGELYVYGPQSTTMDEQVKVSIPPGSYRVRVSGRGFTELGAAGADGEDCYRLRWWLRDQASPAVLRKRWPGWDRYPLPSRRPEGGRSGDSPAPEPGSAESGVAQNATDDAVEQDVPEQLGAVVVVPLDADGRILIVSPHLLGGSQIELTARPLREIGEDPLAAARQLLAEEAGLRADTWNTLLDLPVLPQGMDVASRIYLARDLRPVQRGRPAHREISNATTQRRPAWIDLDDIVDDVFARAIQNPVAAASIVAAAQARDTAWGALRPADQHTFRMPAAAGSDT